MSTLQEFSRYEVVLVPYASGQYPAPLTAWFLDRRDAQAVAALSAPSHKTVAIYDHAEGRSEHPRLIWFSHGPEPADR